MSDGGKGSAPRPIADRKKFEENWDAIFGNGVVGDSVGVHVGSVGGTQSGACGGAKPSTEDKPSE